MKKRLLIAVLIMGLMFPALVRAAELLNITTAGVDGNLVFYDVSKNAICTFDAANRKVSFPSSSNLTISSGGTMTLTGSAITGGTFTSGVFTSSTLSGYTFSNTSATSTVMATSTLSGTTTLSNSTLSGGATLSGTFTGGTLSAPTLAGATGTLTSPTITTGTLSGQTILSGSTLSGGATLSGTFTGGTLASNTLTGSTITSPTITGIDTTYNVSSHEFTTNDDWVMSASEAKSILLTVTSGTNAVNIKAPDVSGRLYAVRCDTTVAGGVTIKKSGGTGIAIASGKTALVIHNGSDYIRLTADAAH